jgi:hypothetical protein
MATRKNFKKTGKKRIKPKGGAKKRKTVRGGVFSFFKRKNAKVYPTQINELTVKEIVYNILKNSENGINTTKTELEKLEKILLTLSQDEFNETIAKLKEKNIYNDSDINDIKYKRRENNNLQFNEALRILNKGNINKGNTDINRVDQHASRHQLDNTRRPQLDALAIPGIQTMIRTYGIEKDNNKELYIFLITTGYKDLTELTTDERDTLFYFKTFFDTKNKIKDWLKIRSEEQKQECIPILIKLGFIKEEDIQYNIFDFLETIKDKTFKTMNWFPDMDNLIVVKKYFKSNKEKIQDFLEKQTPEVREEYNGLLKKFKFDTE